MVRHMRRGIDAFGGIAEPVVLAGIAAKAFVFGFHSARLASLENHCHQPSMFVSVSMGFEINAPRYLVT